MQAFWGVFNLEDYLIECTNQKKPFQQQVFHLH
jgi:hypothetical protein